MALFREHRPRSLRVQLDLLQLPVPRRERRGEHLLTVRTCALTLEI